MKRSRAIDALPPHTRRAMQNMGRDIAIARRSRSLTMDMLAQRASVARSTYQRIEKGDPTVSMGAYAMVLYALGVGDRLARIVEPASDGIGLQLTHEALPKRVRRPKPASAL